MRHNRTKEILKTGGAAFGITVGPNDADLVEMAGLLGFDFAIVDCEHDLFDESALTQVLRAADLHGMTAIARMQKREAVSPSVSSNQRFWGPRWRLPQSR